MVYLAKMKMEQKAVAAYSLVGVVAGVLSNYLTQTSIILAFIMPVVLCFVSMLPFTKVGKGHKKRKMIIFNSFFTFFLVWLTVWIFFYNL